VRKGFCCAPFVPGNRQWRGLTMTGFLRILGSLRLSGPAGDVPLGGDKPRRLIAALALHPNEVVSADRLTDVIWGDHPPRSARENLQTYVWFLRRAMRDAVTCGIAIEATAPGYALRVGVEDFDWHRFTCLTAEASERVATDPATASKLLREALGYWRGPVLAGTADDIAPLRPRIAAMEEARLSALDQRIRADLAIGRHRELPGELSELAAIHPLREQFRAHQMLALYRCGRQAEALTAFHQLREQLAADLGIDPAPPLCRLYEAIICADPSLAVLPRRVFVAGL
jgi:DNA-binding SARP family transcriptional activator